mmetsp:Transcript_11217/g.16387  ORF Transcript_11217/g.16387 Transcript_11217/m.16387 type:complete len:428 (-) Transcript_11217:90-1373(-)
MNQSLRRRLSTATPHVKGTNKHDHYLNPIVPKVPLAFASDDCTSSAGNADIIAGSVPNKSLFRDYGNQYEQHRQHNDVYNDVYHTEHNDATMFSPPPSPRSLTHGLDCSELHDNRRASTTDSTITMGSTTHDAMIQKRMASCRSAPCLLESVMRTSYARRAEYAAKRKPGIPISLRILKFFTFFSMVGMFFMLFVAKLVDSKPFYVGGLQKHEKSQLVYSNAIQCARAYGYTSMFFFSCSILHHQIVYYSHLCFRRLRQCLLQLEFNYRENRAKITAPSPTTKTNYSLPLTTGHVPSSNSSNNRILNARSQRRSGRGNTNGYIYSVYSSICSRFSNNGRYVPASQQTHSTEHGKQTALPTHQTSSCTGALPLYTSPSPTDAGVNAGVAGTSSLLQTFHRSVHRFGVLWKNRPWSKEKRAQRRANKNR